MILIMSYSPVNSAKITSQASPKTTHTETRPFQEIAVNLCSYAGQTYLIIVDCFTDRPAIISLDHGSTCTQVIASIHQSICRTAIPDIVWSDGGPQYTLKQFNDFAHHLGFYTYQVIPFW